MTGTTGMTRINALTRYMYTGMTEMTGITTIMDKSLGTVVQFEHLLIHMKVYPHTTNTVCPYSLPPPHRQC